jgi:phosphate ABC transporter, permease protein PstA
MASWFSNINRARTRFITSNWQQRLLLFVLYLCTALTALSILLVVGYILVKGLGGITWTFLTTPYQPGLGMTGILPMILSTLLLVALTVLIATPIGIAAAIYLSEYSRGGKLIEGIRFAIECLSAIPSILYGLFGYALFVVGLNLRYTILSAAFTLAIMVLPIVIRNTEEALHSVPKAMREGSYGLGAGKLTTILRMVLPCSIGGIVTGVVLAVGRIVGETAAVIYTMGTSPKMPMGFLSSGRTLPVHVYLLSKEGLNISQAFSSAAILLILVAIINALSNWTAHALTPIGRAERQARREQKNK